MVSLRRESGEIAATFSISRIRDLLDIKTRLERVASLRGVRLVIADEAEPNAFASHNPFTIGLTIGMLNLLDGDSDAFAAIMGHELAHLTLGHIARKREREDFADGVSNIFGTALGMVVPMGALMTDLAVMATTTVYSRDDEREADKKGFEYMVAAGFDPHGAVRLWQKMSGAVSGPLLPFLSTHPGGLERIENMQNFANATSSPKSDAFPARTGQPVASIEQNTMNGKLACQGAVVSTWTNCLGTATYPNIGKYVGEFKSGKPNGQGMITFREGDTYIGDWKDGERSGQGTYTSPSGLKYVGEFKGGRHHGHGTTYGQDGSILQSGTWESGKFVPKH